MALTLNNFTGFETGGLEEVAASAGSPDATEATIVRSGARSLKCAGAATAASVDISITEGGSSNAGNNHIVGVAVYFTDITPTGDIDFLKGLASGNQSIGLVLEATTGDLLLKDAGDAEVGSAAAPFQVNTQHYIELHWKDDDTTGLAEVFLDGVSVIGEVTSQDFRNAAAVDEYRLSGGTTSSEDTYFDDFYCMTGATSASDRLGDCEVFKYQSVKNSATPDSSALADDVLNAGTWHRAGETPLASTATNPEYTDAGAGVVYTDATNGSPEGPKNDARIDGDSNIKGMKGISNMLRSGGGGTDHFIHMGNDGGAASDLLKSADLDPTTAFVNYFLITESTIVMPKSTEYCAIGFEQTNAQDYECQEQWVMLLHVPTFTAPTNLSDTDFPDQNYYVGPFHI